MENQAKPEDSSDKTYMYAITIAISPHKRLGKSSKPWSDFTGHEQRMFLTELVGKATLECGLTYDSKDLCFETTQKKHWHIHFHFYANDITMKKFQSLVWKKCGFPKDIPERVCTFTATYYDPRYWYKYETKDQIDQEPPDTDTYIPSYSMLF